MKTKLHFCSSYLQFHGALLLLPEKPCIKVMPALGCHCHCERLPPSPADKEGVQGPWSQAQGCVCKVSLCHGKGAAKPASGAAALPRVQAPGLASEGEGTR